MRDLANYNSYRHGMNADDTFWAFLMTLLLIGLLAGAIYFLVKSSTSHQGSASTTALDEAKKRYAKGEINKKQLDEIRKELKK